MAGKDFVNIVKLTKEFNDWNERVSRGEIESKPADILRWQSLIELAIAQQMSVLSGTLTDLLTLCKSQGKSHTE